MEPITHTLSFTCQVGKARLDTAIRYTYIDGSLGIQQVTHCLNRDFTFDADKSDYLHYLLNFGKRMIEKADRDIEHMKEIARRHNEWLREELQITGAAS